MWFDGAASANGSCAVDSSGAGESTVDRTRSQCLGQMIIAHLYRDEDLSELLQASRRQRLLGHRTLSRGVVQPGSRWRRRNGVRPAATAAHVSA